MRGSSETGPITEPEWPECLLVFCCWQWVQKPEYGDNRQNAGRWEFVESHVVGEYEEYNWLDWTHREGEDDNSEPIMGRAVTMWSLDRGVRLVAFHPPGDWIGWISVGAYERICKEDLWSGLLEGSGTLRFGTIDQVYQVLRITRI